MCLRPDNFNPSSLNSIPFKNLLGMTSSNPPTKASIYSLI